MVRDSRDPGAPGNEGVISIIGPGMRVIGDCDTPGTIRIEGSVEGKVRAGKAVVVGKDGAVNGDIVTQDAVIGGTVSGSIIAESRLELQASCAIEGKIRARRLKLDEGGRVSGEVHIGEPERASATASGASSSARSAVTATASSSPEQKRMESL